MKSAIRPFKIPYRGRKEDEKKERKKEGRGRGRL
jgi:hypothetical protein